jgi:hypothetical protein
MHERECSWMASVGSGLIGALVLTAIHEAGRRVAPHPPRMDVLGRRAAKKTLVAAGRPAPNRAGLQRWALAGDILANTMYYAGVARGRGTSRWGRALLMGAAAGVTAMYLPPYIGLGNAPNRGYASTHVMTTLWYVGGALATAAVASAANRPRATAA